MKTDECKQTITLTGSGNCYAMGGDAVCSEGGKGKHAGEKKCLTKLNFGSFRNGKDNGGENLAFEEGVRANLDLQ